MDINEVLEKALVLNPPVDFGTEVTDWKALVALVNAVPEIQKRLAQKKIRIAAIKLEGEDKFVIIDVDGELIPLREKDEYGI